MLMHVAGTFPDNYIYGKCTDYIWEYGEIGENNTYLRTDHVPQVYIPCRIPCSSLVQYSLNCSLITRYSNTQLQEPATSYQRYACVPTLLLPQFCCYRTKGHSPKNSSRTLGPPHFFRPPLTYHKTGLPTQRF